ncbi:MAG: GNAT family N-acetyltransferase [Rhodothermaceae bacterium]
MSFYKQTGALIFGTRLKRLSDRFLQDVSKLYKSLNLTFEPGWFPVFYLLNEKGTLTMTEIANELKITHSAVSQLVNSLKKKNYLEFIKDTDDKRKIMVTFTEEGLNITEKLVPVWQSLKRSMEELISEGKYSANMLDGLNEIEDRLEERSLLDRVVEDMEKFSTDGLEIIDYEVKYKAQYKKLMLNWLISNYQNDRINVDLLNDPLDTFIKNGGIIRLVKVREEIVAVCVIRTFSKKEAEISYLGIDENWEWRNIGIKLLKDVLKKVKNLKMNKISVSLTEMQENYISLYRKAGFEPVQNKIAQNGIELKLNIEA